MLNKALEELLPLVSGFDITNRDLLDEYLDPHTKSEEQFREFVTAHFSGQDYENISYKRCPVAEILEQVESAAGVYKRPYSDYLVKLSDDDSGDNANLNFTVIPEGEALKGPDTCYFPLLLFICILEFNKIKKPGDLIDGYFEFSWGLRKRRLTNRLVLTVVFRVKIKGGTWQFYDYSSEFPEYYRRNLLFIKSIMMNA